MEPVERLLAIEELKQLKARYCRFTDQQDWVGFRSLFLDDAHCEYGEGVFDDPDVMVEHFRLMLLGGNSVHHCHMPEIDLTGPDAAKGTWTLFDRVELAGGGGWNGYARYWEEYRRVDGRWYIARLRVERLHRLPRGAA